IPHAVSWSGGKGYHITLYFESPVQAKIAKQIGEDIRDLLGLPNSGDPHVEVYPKQSELNDSKKFGSLLRLPLGKHPKTGNCSIFVDPDNDWKEIDPSAVLQQRVFLKDLQKRMNDGGTVTSLIKTLSPYFTSGQRHDMALFVAGALANLEWTEEAVQDLINDIYTNVGDGNVEEWRRAVRDTFKKVHKGERVIGVQGLAKILSSESLQDFIANASKQTFSYTLKNIDAIRLGKGAAWQKVRLASKSIIAFFRENGKLVRDEDDIYWLNNETKDLLRFDGIHWSRFTHNEFGLNPIESFGRQVGESVKLYAYDEAESVKVRRRSYWDTERWWLNLGGPEVYVLNGNPDERKLAWNGDNKILFMNMTDRMHLPN